MEKNFVPKEVLAANIHNIDVKETFSKVVNSCDAINAVLKAMKQLEMGLPLEIPPEDEWELLIYSAEQNTYVYTVDPELNTFDKLLGFARLPKEEQQQIFYRAYYVYRKFFAISDYAINFPLKLVIKD